MQYSKITILVDKFYKKQLQKMARTLKAPLNAYIEAIIEAFAKAYIKQDFSIFENLVTKNNDLVIVRTLENAADDKKIVALEKKGTSKRHCRG